MNYAQQAVKLSISNLEKSYANDIQALENMQVAANLSGKAIHISKTTAVHAISYPLTLNFNIPHGLAVGCLLPKIFHYNSKVNQSNLNDQRGLNFVKDRIKKINENFGTKLTHETILLIRNLLLNLETKKYLDVIDEIIKKKLSLMSQNINLERLKNNPVKINSDCLENVLQIEEKNLS